MNFVLRPWQLLLLILAGWINRDQQDAIEYLLTENQVLREKLGKGRILLNDDQRRRWAVKGKVLGRKSLGKLAKIVSPTRFCAGIESLSLASGITQTRANPLADHAFDNRLWTWLCAWLRRILAGAMTVGPGCFSRTGLPLVGISDRNVSPNFETLLVNKFTVVSSQKFSFSGGLIQTASGRGGGTGLPLGNLSGKSAWAASNVWDRSRRVVMAVR